MSHFEYYVNAVIADRMREADLARRMVSARHRPKPHWGRRGPSRLARLRLRLA